MIRTKQERRSRLRPLRLQWLVPLFAAVSALLLLAAGTWWEVWEPLGQWSSIDTTIVVAGALAAAACAIPGCFLVVRRQSMMGDAISHAALPGVVIAFLVTYWLFGHGDRDTAAMVALSRVAMFAGAIVIGILCAVLTEFVRQVGRVEASAALGVVFTSLFAVGLLLLRAKADDVHIDPDCVLYGTLEKVAMQAALSGEIPAAIWINGGMLFFNLVLVALLFKELQISAFDPQLATTQGIPAPWLHYLLMGQTAITLVAAFESVGSILVIAMLIAPAATAFMLTERLARMILIAVGLAAGSAVLGHVLALILPGILLHPFGLREVETLNSAGMIATAAGLVFLLVALFAPGHGVLSTLLERLRLALRISAEDILGLLYRAQEQKLALDRQRLLETLETAVGGRRWNGLALWNLRRQGAVATTEHTLHLTELGRSWARHLVRSHRLWESYMHKHFALGTDHLHNMAARVEHFIDQETREQLAQELEDAATDAHGTEIPTAPDAPPKSTTGA